MSLKISPKNLTTVQQTIYTAPASTEASVHGLVFTNLGDTTVTMTLQHYKATETATYTLANAVTILGRKTLAWPRPINMTGSDYIQANVSANVVTVAASIYENTQAINKGFNTVGTWNSSITYNANDVVLYNGISYIAIQTNTNQQPDNQTAYWQSIYNVSGVPSVAYTTLQASNFSSPNVVITGGYVSALANITATSTNFTTDYAANFSSPNVRITGGYIQSVTNVFAATGTVTTLNTSAGNVTGPLFATSINSANAVITGGYIQSVINVFATTGTITTLNTTSGNATTLVATNFSSGNVVFTNTTAGNVTAAAMAYQTALDANTTAGTAYVTFAPIGGTGNARQNINTSFTFNPSTANVSASGFLGAGYFTTLSATGTTTLSGTTVLSGNVQVTGQGQFITNNLIVTGNLFVKGNTTTIDSIAVTTNDLYFVAASNAGTTAAADGAGILTPYSALQYRSATTSWQSNVGIFPSTNNTLALGGASNNWSNLYATNLYGTLQTAAQTNVTSLGSLSGLTVTGATNLATTTASTLNTSSGNVTGPLFATSINTANVVIIGGYIQSVINVFATTGTVTTLNSTNGNVTTLAATNFSSGNVNFTNTTAGTVSTATNAYNSVLLANTSAGVSYITFTSIGAAGNAQLSVNSLLTAYGSTGNLFVNSNAQSINTSTGSLSTNGGVSITTGNLYIGGSGGNAIVATGYIYDTIGEIRSLPQAAQTANPYTAVALDAGRTISYGTSSGNVALPGGSVFTAGQVITVFNNTTTNITISQSVGSTIRLAGTATTGNRTLAQYGLATALCVTGGATPTFIVSGAGLT